MVRAILSSILGYAVMVAWILTGIALLWFILGSDFAFTNESTVATTRWSVVMLGCGLLAAVAGGWVATRLGGLTANRILLGLIAVLGVVSIVTQWNAQPLPLPDGKTPQNLTFAEAGQYAVSPDWYNVVIVVVGLIGAWVGARLARSSRIASPSIAP